MFGDETLPNLAEDTWRVFSHRDSLRRKIKPTQAIVWVRLKELQRLDLSGLDLLRCLVDIAFELVVGGLIVTEIVKVLLGQSTQTYEGPVDQL